MTDTQQDRIAGRSQSGIFAWEQFPEASLDVLYGAGTMPLALRNANRDLDRVEDRLHRHAGFHCERERVEHLFKLYESTRAPLDAASSAEPKRQLQKANVCLGFWNQQES